MDGVLVIDKAAGPTSHDVVASVRKLLKAKKVGHTGTLDPAATGVLPLVLGRATKIARYLTGSAKTYRATLRLGVSTDTLDAEGEVLQEREVVCSPDEVATVVASFVGEIDQLPPMYSAKKVDGKRLYELARKGVEVEREPKRVTLYRIDLLDCSLPTVTLEVACSAGTYLRTLAEDIGEKLGCGGHLQELRRLRAGPFTLDQAVTLEELADDRESALGRLIPMGNALQELPTIKLPVSIARMVASGHQLTVADLRALDVPELAPEDPVTLSLDDGQVVAVARALIASGELVTSRRDTRALKTERVLER